jgi:hypothetical protein
MLEIRRSRHSRVKMLGLSFSSLWYETTTFKAVKLFVVPFVIYLAWRQQHLINTSNRVEQINNLMIAERQKKNGMSWCNVGSPALANVTMLFLNNEFDGWERNRQLSYLLDKDQR